MLKRNFQRKKYIYKYSRFLNKAIFLHFIQLSWNWRRKKTWRTRLKLEKKEKKRQNIIAWSAHEKPWSLDSQRCTLRWAWTYRIGWRLRPLGGSGAGPGTTCRRTRTRSEHICKITKFYVVSYSLPEEIML